MSAMSNADIILNELRRGDSVTFARVTSTVTRKVRGFQTDMRGWRTGVYVRYKKQYMFLVRPHQIVSRGPQS